MGQANCFGPNNTIVKTIKNAFKDIAEGPGKNNEAMKIIAPLADFVENIGAEANKRARQIGLPEGLLPIVEIRDTPWEAAKKHHRSLRAALAHVDRVRRRFFPF